MRGILVVGGSGGIGLELIQKLKKNGEDVVFTYRTQKEDIKQIELNNGAKAIQYDFQISESQKELAEIVLKNEFKGLVNVNM